LDAAGRIPQFFLADGLIKVRLTDRAGVVQLAADGIQVIGPSSGGGGGGAAVDPTTLIQTGNMIFRYGVGALTGYVRLNALTIGSATSGASERANADCQALFNYLWGVDANLPVSSGRGASAVADWSANKQIGLPDWRGYALGALDDMGNAAAGRLTASYFGATATVLGAVGGQESRILTAAQTPLVQHYHAMYLTDPGHIHSVPNIQAGGIYSNNGNNAGTPYFIGGSINTASVAAGIRAGSTPGAGDNLTTGPNINPTPTALAAIGPRKLCTFYLKL
jgi:hypothetical protein